MVRVLTCAFPMVLHLDVLVLLDLSLVPMEHNVKVCIDYILISTDLINTWIIN